MKNQRYEDILKEYSRLDILDLYKKMGIDGEGLEKGEVDERRIKFGENILLEDKSNTIFHRILISLINPFNVILFFIGLFSLIASILIPSYSVKNSATTIILFAMLLISIFIRLPQEIHAKNTIDKLGKLVKESVTVFRDGGKIEILAEDLVVGDRIVFSAGEKLAVDVRITKAFDLFISQATITGESELLEKNSEKLFDEGKFSAIQLPNMAFMGTTVMSGWGEGVVVGVGKDTIYGSISNRAFENKRTVQKGLKDIAWVMLKFMFVLVPLVFFTLGITKGKWLESFAFAMSISCGLVPEMLPMVITTCLTKGSISLQKKKTIVKDISAMQALGSMEVLCMDKTGTLTNESIILEYYMDILGNESQKSLDLAFINSSYNYGIANPIDKAITACKTMPKREEYFEKLLKRYEKIDDLPFNYKRKIVTVMVKDLEKNKNYIISKGDIKGILNACSYFEYRDQVSPISEDMLESVSMVVDDMLNDGMKVIAIARKELSTDKLHYDDEKDMILMGYLAFFDAPKEMASQSIGLLKDLNVIPKVLTGDHSFIARSVCDRVGIESEKIFTGEEINHLTDEELQIIVERYNIFSELAPKQKERIVRLLKNKHKSVGFLGDGLNDLAALNEADIGISVDNAINVTKESSDIILLEKDLNILEEAIVEGRKTFTNMLKYIKITESSNFGNILSIVFASLFLPFLPMTSIQILLLNLLYDAICLVIPWDNVDEEDLLSPKEWSGKKLSKFMLSFGPISSLFDIITFLFLYFILCPMMVGDTFLNLTDPNLQLKYIMIFNTGWFLESMWTQVLILHFLRTKKIPFVQSRPSKMVITITIIGVITFTGLTFTDLASLFGLTSLYPVYFIFLIAVVITYMLLTTIIKDIYYKKNKELI